MAGKKFVKIRGKIMAVYFPGAAVNFPEGIFFWAVKWNLPIPEPDPETGSDKHVLIFPLNLGHLKHLLHRRSRQAWD